MTVGGEGEVLVLAGLSSDRSDRQANLDVTRVTLEEVLEVSSVHVTDILDGALTPSSLLDSMIPFLSSVERNPKTLELMLDSEATSSLPIPESTVSEAVALKRPPLSEPSSAASLVSEAHSMVSNVRELSNLTVDMEGW